MNPAVAELSPEMQGCIENCSSCHKICVATLAYCLKKGGQHAEAAHLRLLADCAEICQMSANFMLRGSPLHVLTCGACAEVCQKCADSCAAMQDDAVMKACAEACRACVASCRSMSQKA